MRKLIIVLLCMLMMAAIAHAEGTVVTAVATDVNPDALLSIAVDAKIMDYDPADNTLAVELLIPERFDPDEIMNLKPGDGIYTQGQEVDIHSISEIDGYIVLNENEENEIWLYESIDMYYWIAEDDDHTWNVFTDLHVPVSEHLLFLDEIDPLTGEILIYPTVHNRTEFLSMLETEKSNGSGFDIRNVRIVFDENGEVALITRFYVPWQ